MIRDFRYLSGTASGFSPRLGRHAHGRELRHIPGGGAPDPHALRWITSTPFFDPMGDTNWKVFYKRIENADRFYHQSSYASITGTLNEHGVRNAAEHIGYGWEWRYSGYSSPSTGTGYQPPVRFTTAITNAATAGHLQTGQSANLNNPLTWLMIHYGRPVIPKGSEFYKSNYDGLGGIQSNQNGQHYYDTGFSLSTKYLRQTAAESPWVEQLRSATTQICGYPEAVPGDFLIGMLPTDHWTGPRGIERIGIRLGLSDDGYFGYDDVSPQLYSFDADWSQYSTDNTSIADWHTIHQWKGSLRINGTYPAVPYWLDRRIYKGLFTNDSKLSGSRVKFKYKVFLGGVDITTQSLDDQPWSVNLWNGQRTELDITIPDGWKYEQTEIAVELYFWEDTERGGFSSFQHSTIAFGQNGLGDFVWPGIDIVYNLANDVTEPQNVTISEPVFSWTNGRVLPLSGRLAVRSADLWAGRTEETYTIATSDYDVDLVTGYFPAGNNHLADVLPITENRSGGQQNIECIHMPTAVDAYVNAFGHWSGEEQQFVERLKLSQDLLPNPTGQFPSGSDTVQTADNFVPLYPGTVENTITVSPS